LRRTGSGGGCGGVNGYVLVIAEKPKAARKIAEALSGGRARWCKGIGKAGYWVLEFDGNRMVVASAVGHLFGLYSSLRGFPVFSYEWRPLWEIDSSASYTKPYYELLGKLARGAVLYVNACDYDIEGSVIGYMVIRWFGDLRRARRAKFSSLTAGELIRAFRRLERLDIEMVEAGLARHELDWLWGINVSRALMESVRKVTGKRIILSAGRVQSPTLVELARRDIDRRLYVPLPFFKIIVVFDAGGSEVRVEVGRYRSKPEALEVASRIRGERRAVVERVEEKRFTIEPPYPFNLPDLQAEASRVFGYSPYFTQKVAEELYLDGLISYPRTNSQRLPPDLDYRGILSGLARVAPYRELIDTLLRETQGELRPRNGPKDDPAHPAIHPTGAVPREPLRGARAKLYDLIVRRFLATMGASAAYVMVRAILKVAGIEVAVSGKRLVRKGWLRLYSPYAAFNEKTLPGLQRGQVLAVKTVRVQRGYTRPPERYTRMKIVKWMESVGIGTEATRARIVELLFQRGYLEEKGGRIRVTGLGLAVVKVLEEYFSDLTSVALTRSFEEKLQEILHGRRRREEVVEEAKRVLLDKLSVFKSSHIDGAGRMLAESLGLLKPQSACRVCGAREYADGLCELHYRAFVALRDAYIEWRKRVPGITLGDFLAQLRRMAGVGEAVKELMERLPDYLAMLASHEPSE